jgi:hypothetical protein
MLSPSLRKLALTVHVTASVGWLGAVAAFLALSIIGMTSDQEPTVRAVYLAMEASGWYVLVPLSVASLLSGVIQSLGTRWGLLRHYWVVIKLCINVIASIILVLYTQTLAELADRAGGPATGHELDALRSPSPVIHAAAALILLVMATILSVYKPRGLTRHGQRKARQQARILASQAP